MMSPKEIKKLIAAGETLTGEFKSDRKKISDSEVVEEVVSMANADGGHIFIGIEDNGIVSGIDALRYGPKYNYTRLAPMILGNTTPSLNTNVYLSQHSTGKDILVIEVERSDVPCATNKGKCLRRTIGVDGKPQSVPFYPHEQQSRQINFGNIDFSAKAVQTLRFEHLNPLQFERLKQTIVRLRGDKELLELSAEDLAKALRLVETRNGKLIPNIAGLLLLGHDAVIREKLPNHAVHFQVLDAQGNVRVNDTFYTPLLEIADEIEKRFSARNEEKEVLYGLTRIPVPNYSIEGFREAVGNALLHRDYSKNAAIYMQWYPEHMLIINPGGFPDGITLNNILTHEPKPRNLRLAEAFKRVGLIEQTGRGIDKIFLGQLRYGRPAPDYSTSDAENVRVILNGGEGSLEFTAFVFQQEKESSVAFSIDEIIILNSLYLDHRCNSAGVAHLIQKPETQAKRILEKLVGRGLIEAQGEKNDRIYILSSLVYRQLGNAEGYIRAGGMGWIAKEVVALEYARSHDRIDVATLAKLLHIKEKPAQRLLRKMALEDLLKKHGNRGRGVYYTPKTPN